MSGFVGPGRAAAHGHRHPFQRSDRRRHGSAAFADHQRNRRRGEHLARLEGLTKDYDCALILSRSAAEAAGLDLGGETLHEVAVKGRVEKVQFYALKEVLKP